ncbi:MAG: PA3496 family putative envelope integrity protein [Pontibacterium sp.]
MQSKEQNSLSNVQTEVFDLIVGFEENNKISQKKTASKRSLEARRAIERHFEDKALTEAVDDPWINELFED